MREKSRDRMRLSNERIVYHEFNQKTWTQTIKILYDTYQENENCELPLRIANNVNG